jgi:putative acetyltransferase
MQSHGRELATGQLRLRPANVNDAAGIRAVHEAAFGRADEANLVKALQDSGSIRISLVAMQSKDIVGHILFSKMEAPFPALGLGPVAVLPREQRRGIGSKLILEGLQRAMEEGWKGVFVVGEPRFYERFGFSIRQASGFGCTYSGPFFMVKALSELPTSTGSVEYAAAFREFE